MDASHVAFSWAKYHGTAQGKKTNQISFRLSAPPSDLSFRITPHNFPSVAPIAPFNSHSWGGSHRNFSCFGCRETRGGSGVPLLRPATESCTMQEQHPQHTSRILQYLTSMATYLIRNLPAWHSRTSPYCYLSRFGEPCTIAGSNAQCVPKLRTKVLITKKSTHSA